MQPVALFECTRGSIPKYYPVTGRYRGRHDENGAGEWHKGAESVHRKEILPRSSVQPKLELGA